MKLKKELTLIDVFSVSTGAMISSGLFVLPGLAHAQAGPAVILSYFLAGLLAMTGMLSQAELVSAMPKAGGAYFYITRSMGPAAGTINGLITWFSLSLKTAFALIGMAAFIILIFPIIEIHVVAIFLCILFAGLNIAGVKKAGRMQVVLVMGLISILLIYIVIGFPAVNVHNLVPFAPNGAAAVLSTAGMVFISYGGLLKVASVAEEIKNPTRNIPLGMIIALLVVTILYTLVVFITSGVLGADQLDNSLTPISDGAGVFMHKSGRLMLNSAAFFAFITTANAGIMAASRYPLALSRDGLLPDIFGKISSRFHTPYISILFTGFFIIIALMFNLNVLVKMASTVLILTFLFSCLSVIVMRESRLQNYEPKFRSPLYPWMQIAGIIGCALLVIEMGMHALFAFSIFIAGGLFVYLFYGRIRSNREYALLHLIERITSKELTTRVLESELKEIIKERDDIVKDRFDCVIENAIVMDIDKSISMDDFFQLTAAKLSVKLNISQSRLYNLLIKREQESSTIISHTLAIPHIVIDGNHIFEIMLVRCRDGIIFPDSTCGIKAVCVLAGSRDERNFHLRALAAIAQIVQNPRFEKRWMSARSTEDLRDLVLLSKRRRLK